MRKTTIIALSVAFMIQVTLQHAGHSHHHHDHSHDHAHDHSHHGHSHAKVKKAETAKKADKPAGNDQKLIN